MTEGKQARVVEGVVVESLPSLIFKVRLLGGDVVLGYLAGRMRLNYIKIFPGDRVLVEINDGGARGRIVKRL